MTRWFWTDNAWMEACLFNRVPKIADRLVYNMITTLSLNKFRVKFIIPITNMNWNRYGDTWNITHDSICLSVALKLFYLLWQFDFNWESDIEMISCTFIALSIWVRHTRICCLLKVAKTRIILPFYDQRIESTFINIFFWETWFLQIT